MKKIPFAQAQFIASAFNADSFPKLFTSGGNPMPEIALVGRSNVGKSSLINHLLKSPLAKTSSTPGKTQSINFFSIDEQLALVDLPGYGYAKVPKQVRDQWAGIIDHYLQSRSTLRLILFLIDARRTLTEEDGALAKWACFHQKPMVFIFTKADKLSESEKRANTLVSLNALHNFLYSAPLDFANSDSARHSKIEAKQLNEEDHSRIGKADEEDRFGKVATSQNSQNLRGRSIYSSPVNFLHYSIKDSRARIELIDKINVLLKVHGTNQ